MTDPDFVRPTKRCLDDLSIAVPNLAVRLHDMEHPIVIRAQQVPDKVRSGGAERVVSLTDRTWFKVKTSTWRAVASEIGRAPDGIPQSWWIGAAGTRAADSQQHDFYDRLSAEAHAGGAKTCSTDFLLPNSWDEMRLLAEAGVFAISVLHNRVRQAAAESLLNGDVRAFDIGDRNVRVRLRMLDDGQVYLAIGATGSIDVPFLTTLLSAIPGISADDWLPEPSEQLGIELAPGEILWSALIDASTQATLISEAQQD